MLPSEELPEEETPGVDLVEGNPPSHLDLKMTSRGPVTQKKIGPGARETTYWEYNGSERWLPWTGYLVPMQTIRF
ncbi:hypothetical protein E2C01_055034 [Portunus trituberculatus]|uniref:Uncharacterized protein n=1 Tax=Portunus trituberculatus TaxID=210409 RepID=A0A5B7GQ56_PORTR|nr:hypothetical protein [Portunus trituberculatus]